MTALPLHPALPPGARSDFVEISLGRVHYVTAGEGPPLVLVHGGYGSWTHWIANITSLARQYTVVAIDMPGFGQSCDARRDSSLLDMAALVWEALTAIRDSIAPAGQQERLRIAGFSFGTAVSTQIALLQPDAVHALLLVNPPGLGEVSEEVKAMQVRAAQVARDRGLRAGLEVTLRELMLWNQTLADEQALDMLEQCVVQTRFVSRRLSRSVRLRPMLADLQVPVHVLLGQNDPHQRHELEQRRAWLAQLLGPENVSVYPDTAHWLQYEQSDRFNRFALDFFQTASPYPRKPLS